MITCEHWYFLVHPRFSSATVIVCNARPIFSLIISACCISSSNCSSSVSLTIFVKSGVLDFSSSVCWYYLSLCVKLIDCFVE